MQTTLKEMRQRSALASIVRDKAQIVKRRGLNLIREKTARKQRARLSKGGGVAAGDFG